MAEQVGVRATAVGLELLGFALKDVIPPGEMRTLLARVIESQKEAEANVICRREDTQATRSLAQCSKVLAENPLLVRFKELEAYAELAAKAGQVHVVLGGGGMKGLQLNVTTWRALRRGGWCACASQARGRDVPTPCMIPWAGRQCGVSRFALTGEWVDVNGAAPGWTGAQRAARGP